MNLISPLVHGVRKYPSYSLLADKDYMGVAPDFVQMRPAAGYDLVRSMP
jgi:hypothetical protein